MSKEHSVSYLTGKLTLDAHGDVTPVARQIRRDTTAAKNRTTDAPDRDGCAASPTREDFATGNGDTAPSGSVSFFQLPAGGVGSSSSIRLRRSSH